MIVLIICRLLRDQNQLQYDDTSLTFIRHVTSLIENKYSSTNGILEIQSSSCRLAGHLLCSHLLKMLFALYNVDPMLPNHNTIKIESISRKSVYNFKYSTFKKN